MCGLIGYYSQNVDYNSDKIKIIMLYNQSRGEHSSGLYVKDVGIVKAEGKTSENLIPKVKFPAVGKILIGHTRQATWGAKTKENSHPFRADDLVVAHNGRITNAWQLAQGNVDKSFKSTFDVDSEIIPKYMNHLKGQTPENFINNALLALEGPQALIFTDESEPNRLYFFRRDQESAVDERPLFRGTFKVGNEDTFYLSSIKESLEAIDCVNVTEVKTDCLYWYEGGQLSYRKINFPKSKISKSNHVTTNQNCQIGNKIHTPPQQSVIDFKRETTRHLGPDIKDSALDYEEIFEERLSKFCKTDLVIVKKPSETVTCPDCNGDGYVDLDMEMHMVSSKGYLCGNCEGRGTIPSISVLTPAEQLSEKARLDKWFENNGNYRKNISNEHLVCEIDDKVYVTFGQYLGTIGRIVHSTKAQDNYWYTIETDSELRINVGGKQIALYKTADGIMRNSITALEAKYGVNPVNKGLIKRTEPIEVATQQKPFSSIRNNVVFEDADLGDIVSYLNSDDRHVICEVKGKDPLTQQLKLEILTGTPGKRVFALAEECKLIEKCSDKCIWSLEDLCILLNDYYPRERLVGSVVELLEETDTDLSNIINVMLTPKDEVLSKELYKIKENLRVTAINEIYTNHTTKIMDLKKESLKPISI